MDCSGKLTAAPVSRLTLVGSGRSCCGTGGGAEVGSSKLPHTSAGAFQSELGSTELPSGETQRPSTLNESSEEEAEVRNKLVTHSVLTTRRPPGADRARADPSQALQDHKTPESVKRWKLRHLVATWDACVVHPPGLSPAKETSFRSAVGIPVSITVHDSARRTFHNVSLTEWPERQHGKHELKLLLRSLKSLVVKIESLLASYSLRQQQQNEIGLSFGKTSLFIKNEL